VLRISVGGGGGGEDHAADTGFDEGAHEGDALLDIVLVIPGGIFYGFADERHGGEMDAGFELVFASDSLEQSAVADIALVERDVLVERGAMTANQIVQNHYAFACGAQ
jgi:hypothetical protein